MDNNETPLPGSEGKISVYEAATLTENWRSYLEISGQEFQAKSFLIPITSVKSLLNNNPEAESMRIYFGLEDSKNPISAKAVLVPVVNGNDIIFIPGSDEDLNSEDDSNLYDRSALCPPNCSSPNILNP